MIKSISTLFVAFAIASTAHAGEAQITKDNPFDHDHPLNAPTSFSIENQMGQVEFEAIDGNRLRISATTEGEEAITLRYEETALGQYKIVVEYPSGGSSGSINVSIGGDLIIGDVVVSGASRGIQVSPVFISGRQHSTQSSVFIGPEPLYLRVGVPRSLLANLTIKTGSADQTVTGAFPGPFENKRVIDLHSGSGEVICRDACAYGEFRIKTGSGDVAVGKIRANKGMIETGAGRVRLANVDGVFIVETGSGKISSTEGTGPLTIKTSSGTIDLADQNRTDLEIKAGSANITARGGSGYTRIVTNSGKTELSQRMGGPVAINTGSGNVDLDDVDGDLRVEGNSSRVTATRVRADVIQIKLGSGDLELKESTGRATIVTNSGSVKVSDHTKGSVDAKTGSGDIRFSNSDETVTEEAQSRSGAVRKSGRPKSDADCETGMDDDIFSKMKKPGWPFI